MPTGEFFFIMYTNEHGGFVTFLGGSENAGLGITKWVHYVSLLVGFGQNITIV